MGAVRKTESNITSDYLSDVIYIHKINEAQTNRRNKYKNRYLSSCAYLLDLTVKNHPTL